MLYTYRDIATGDRSSQKPHLALSFLRLQECGHRAQGGENQLLLRHFSSWSWLSAKWGFSANIAFFSPFLGIILPFLLYAELLWNCPDPPPLHKEASQSPGSLHYFSILPESFKILSIWEAGQSCKGGAPQVGAVWNHLPYSRWLDTLLYCLQHSGKSWTTVRNCMMDGDEPMAINLLVCLLISIKIIEEKNPQTTEVFIETKVTRN